MDLTIVVLPYTIVALTLHSNTLHLHYYSMDALYMYVSLLSEINYYYYYSYYYYTSTRLCAVAVYVGLDMSRHEMQPASPAE